MQKWEYKIVKDVTDEQLDELGQAGWELVGTTFRDNGTVVYWYFKRPRS